MPKTLFKYEMVESSVGVEHITVNTLVNTQEEYLIEHTPVKVQFETADFRKKQDVSCGS